LPVVSVRIGSIPALEGRQPIMIPPNTGSVTPAYAEYQGIIDDALHKEEPSASIPWGAAPVPGWASQLRPVRIVDLGCATGRFTEAVLTRLGQWNCLRRLRKLTLVEQEPAFGGAGHSAVDEIRRRCNRILSEQGVRSVDIELRNEGVKVTGGASSRSRLHIGSNAFPNADLIVASHFTYYFGGGGTDLLRALAPELLRTGGLAWIIVRKRECPIYRERLALLRQNDSTYTEGGYAEDMEEAIGRGDTQLKLVARKDWSFLPPSRIRPSDMSLINLLMWREPYAQSSPERQASTRRAVQARENLFAERHMVLKASL
jgi:SAM-dependent methyltransferase